VSARAVGLRAVDRSGSDDELRDEAVAECESVTEVDGVAREVAVEPVVDDPHVRSRGGRAEVATGVRVLAARGLEPAANFAGAVVLAIVVDDSCLLCERGEGGVGVVAVVRAEVARDDLGGARCWSARRRARSCGTSGFTRV
jgi:hypothetical protein